MAAEIIDIAEAVVAGLNAATLSQPVNAVRGYTPIFDLQDLDTLHVTVMPRSDEGKLDTRSSAQHEFGIDIAVQKKPAILDNAGLDPLVLLTQEIADFFLYGQRVAGTVLMSPEIRVLFLQDHIVKFRQFTSVVSLTFKG